MRLKDEIIQEHRKQHGETLSNNESNDIVNDDSDSEKLKWQYFDEKVYVDKTRVQQGQDAYAKNKFNQAACDKLKSNRDIPDTRHTR